MNHTSWWRPHVDISTMAHAYQNGCKLKSNVLNAVRNYLLTNDYYIHPIIIENYEESDKSSIAVPYAWKFIIANSRHRLSLVCEISFSSIAKTSSFIILSRYWIFHLKTTIFQIWNSLVLFILINHESFLFWEGDILVRMHHWFSFISWL